MLGLLQALLCKHPIAGGGWGISPPSTGRGHGSLLLLESWIKSQVGLVLGKVSSRAPPFPCHKRVPGMQPLIQEKHTAELLSAISQHRESSTSL